MKLVTAWFFGSVLLIISLYLLAFLGCLVLCFVFFDVSPMLKMINGFTWFGFRTLCVFSLMIIGAILVFDEAIH